MISMKNTYIPNVDGKLRDLFIAECGKQELKVNSERTLDGGYDYLEVYNGRICGTYHIEHDAKALTLADFEPVKPKRMRVEYVKLKGLDKEIAGVFSNETIYYMSSNNHDSQGEKYTEINNLNQLACINNFYIKIETEIKTEQRWIVVNQNRKSLDSMIMFDSEDSAMSCVDAGQVIEITVEV